MDSYGAELQGFEQLMAELLKLPDVMQKRVIKGAVAKGAKIIKDEAVARAPVDSGTLKAAIYMARLVNQCTPNDEVWLVSARSGKQYQTRKLKSGKDSANRDAFYAKWVEFGHYARTPKGVTKSGKAAGRALGVTSWVAARPFMRPAFETKKSEAVTAMQTYSIYKLPEVASLFIYLKAA